MQDQATINARIKRSLKARGDAVLESYGVSPTQAIRGLWSEMARTRTVPDFVLAEARRGGDKDRRRKLTALRDLASGDKTEAKR
ncbi:MAG: type II toxin-antitoxin system RelB/DinJ family antitoxin [Adlercreutzia sp.]|nr:type II toxin-antitoxin system RelB/DinJ family antitoxin [Adlercreutzia sp.]